MAAIKHGTLVAATMATVALDPGHRRVEVMNRTGTADIFFRADGTNPTVSGDDCFAVPAVAGAALAVPFESTDVKLISSGTPSYTVTALVD